ncbi:hypothetical protein LSH36_90g05044 [Paralvinella palmiformis]|uniref:Serine/threonine-protein kinase Chk2 n=1 Tax=Paralvinella palmiformis TaxID=53620 RepID=A0AAD9K0K7_9ANNE|nr:hypothetical protein LSH36_90g05044 [Paralvinella palmiformis]
MDVDMRSPLKETDVNTNSPIYTRSRSSYNSLPNSMDTCTLSTDYIDDLAFDAEEVNEQSWGKLFPVGACFKSVDLIKDEYSFGRGEVCDYQFDMPEMKNSPCFLAYSKVHFKIIKENTSTGVHIFLIDVSSNGTFINGEKVGKNCKQVLNNNDEIALCLKRNKAFVFMDAAGSENRDIPEELKKKYTLSRELGRGACGEVRLAFEKGTSKRYAIKIIQKKRFSLNGQLKFNVTGDVLNEVRILKSLRHPCIIGIEDVFDTTDMLFIVLELIEGGELFDRIVSINSFDDPTAKLIFYLIASGVKYLHDQGITHRDLKPENILLVDEGSETLIKVTDFGLSKFVDANTMMKTFCGTPQYLAPEVLKTGGTASYTKAVDCWSLGVILYICLVGYPPFTDDRKDMALPRQIVGGHYEMPDKYWRNVSSNAKDLDEKMKKKADLLMSSDPMRPPQDVPKKRQSEGETSPAKKTKIG